MADVKMQSCGTNSQQLEENQRKTSPAPPLPQPHLQQQWLAMRYPPTMVMPHQLMFAAATAPPYSPYHQYHHHHHHQLHHQPRGYKHQNSSNGENKTIWVGDLHHWMDENYLHSSFVSVGEIASIKVIRNKHTCVSEGYGFVEFHSHEVAEKVLQTYNGAPMLNTDQPFRLNWASFSTGEKRLENGPDLSIFVGDLAPDVTDSFLHETFSSKYPSVKAAKVVFDTNTGRSKGYGFVRFGDDNERARAMTEMNGAKCSSRPMRIGAATPRKSNGHQQQGGYMSNGTLADPDVDTLNTTIFVGGLDPNVTDEDLRQPFAEFGEIISVKIPAGKGCGFVQYVNRTSAEEALEKLNGTVVGKQTVRLSWGRNPANKQLRGETVNLWVGPYYGGGQYYNGYGYMMPPPNDPRMYAAAGYGAYPVYDSHQQQVS